ncbi:hypothetical protein E3J62_03155 [candidate division TA06 bacterium]|uniref:Uncharacterized protein n=1 Tax=candidate division TA06 bacterium TaxID=2250710 RepID=A0A523UWX9_UNCT6|nr:MAG: hypothetical protein E3J62_03155 [candidate division TA06 bacterium]
MADERRERFLQRGWKTCRLLGVALLALGFIEAVAMFVTMASSGWRQWPPALSGVNPVVHLIMGYFFLLGANIIKTLLEIIDELKTTV